MKRLATFALLLLAVACTAPSPSVPTLAAPLTAAPAPSTPTLAAPPTATTANAAPIPNLPTLVVVPTTLADDTAQFALALIPAYTNDLTTLNQPTRYALTLQLDPSVPALTGSQTVRYYNRQAMPLNEVYFRLFANYPDSGGKITVTRVTVNGAPVTTTLEAQNTALRVPLPAPLAPASSVTLLLDYSVAIPYGNPKHYDDFGANVNITTLPSVYPLIPAYDAKGWHLEVAPPYGDLVYSDAALYAVTVTVPSTLTIIASGSTVGTTTNANGTTTWHIVGAPMRDFDLNMTSRLQKASAQVGETTINSYYEPGDADAGKRALDIAVNAFKTFQTRVGAYPYRELDVVETPTTAGGIEYPGLVVINRELYRDRDYRDEFEFVIAHEVAHQWFYGLTGNDQVNEPWVDESLVQYLTLIYYEDAYGARAGQQILRGEFQNQYQKAKERGRDKAANLPVAAYTETQYDEIVYGKAPLFFDAIRKKMGDALFFQFLKTYFARYRYKIATGDALLRTAESVYGASLRAEYDQWIALP
jgi:hypothetical protein